MRVAGGINRHDDALIGFVGIPFHDFFLQKRDDAVRGNRVIFLPDFRVFGQFDFLLGIVKRSFFAGCHAGRAHDADVAGGDGFFKLPAGRVEKNFQRVGKHRGVALNDLDIPGVRRNFVLAVNV